MGKNLSHTILHHRFHNGKILIYKLAHGTKPVEDRNFYFRFLNPNGTGYIRRSAKTPNQAEAQSVAFEHYEQSHIRKTLGLKKETTTIHDLVNGFIHELSSNEATTYKRDTTLNAYIIPFFSQYEDLSKIDDDTIWEYLYWRDETYTGARNTTGGKISIRTISMDLSLIKFLVRRGFEKRWILTMPKFPTTDEIERRGGFPNFVYTEAKDRRGVWNSEQDNAISKWMAKFRKTWINTMRKDKGEDIGSRKTFDFHHRATRYNWVCFYLWIRIVRASGVRPHLIRTMTIDTIQLFKDTDGLEYTIIKILRHQSKVKKRREVVANDMNRLYLIWEDYKYEYEKFFGRKPQPKDLAFPMPTNFERQRKVWRTFRRYIRNLDESEGIILSHIYDDYGEKQVISLYSLRKSYISKALQRPELTPYMVATATGTSLKLLQSVYDVNLQRVHRKAFTKAVRNLMEQDSLRKENQ